MRVFSIICKYAKHIFQKHNNKNIIETTTYLESERIEAEKQVKITDSIYNNKFSFTKGLDCCLNSDYGIVLTLNGKYAKTRQYSIIDDKRFYEGHFSDTMQQENIKATHAILLSENFSSNKINDLMDIPNKLHKERFLQIGIAMFSPNSIYNFDRSEFLYNFCDDTRKAIDKIVENERINKTL